MKKNYFRIQLIALSIMMLVMNLSMASDNPYEVELTVPNQTESIRVALLPEAMKTLLIQLTGSTSAVDTPAFLDACQHADHYITQFSYHAAHPKSEMPATEYKLRLHFNEAMIKELLKKSRLPIVDKKRPLTLVWVVLEKEGKKSLLGGEENTKLENNLRNLASARGIPILFPLLDITDTDLVSSEDVWHFNNITLEKSAERYHAEAVLAIRITELPNLKRAECRLQLNGKLHTWEASGLELEQVLSASLEKLNQYLILGSSNQVSSGAAPNLNGPSSEVLLAIAGIEIQENFIKIRRYLQGLPAVSSMELSEITPTQTVFRLQVRGGREGLENSIRQDSILTEVPTQISDKVLMYKIAY